MKSIMKTKFVGWSRRGRSRGPGREVGNIFVGFNFQISPVLSVDITLALLRSVWIPELLGLNCIVVLLVYAILACSSKCL